MCCHKSNTIIHCDHIKPSSKFPELEEDLGNLQLLCEKCNIEKSNIDYTDYRTKENKEALYRFLSFRKKHQIIFN